MAVFRVERTGDYTVMSNFHLKDKRLSLKAKGLLSQMLSLPDDWDYTLSGLSYINRETDPSKDAAIRDREFERLSAENGAGWLCGQAGTAGAEGVGLPDAPKQQQLESADPQSA